MNLKTILILAFLTAAAGFAGAQTAYDGSWSGKLNAGQVSLTLVLNISSDAQGNISCTMDSPDQGAKGIRAEAAIKNGISLEVKVPQLGAEYRGMLFNGKISGTFTQMGSSFPLILSKGVEKMRRPQTPQGPFPYKEEEISFSNDAAGAIFSGTLVTPEAMTASTPVVIMVSGSGLQNRDEEVFEHKPFSVIADYLARHGIASLRYDDRSFGKSEGGDISEATTKDFAEDAKCGIKYLKTRNFKGKIGILGHSEGANIAIMLGAASEADFVVSLAGIGVKGDEALTAQANRIMELQGIPQKLSVPMYRQNVAAQGNAWLNWFIDYDPLPDISNCKCPVYAANGSKDVQVISSLNLSSIAENLPSNPSNTVKEYPSLNHLFQHCQSGATTEYRNIEETVSPELLEDLTGWISGL